MKNSIAFFPSPSPSLFLAYNINEMKETYSITSKVLLDFYHFKRIQLEIFGQNLRNIRSQFRLVAAFIQLYDIYIYGIYRKTFSGERYQKAPRPLSVSQTAFVLNRPAQFVERSASSCPSVRTPGTPNYLSHVTVVQAWFRRNNLIWNERLYIYIERERERAIENWKAGDTDRVGVWRNDNW